MMDILKAEIERKKRQIEESKVLVPNKKFFKRADLAAKHEEEYMKKYAPKILEENTLRRTEYNKETHGGEGDGEIPELPRKEVIRRLRERGEPILLFGETHSEAFQRLRELEILRPEIVKGLRNDFQAAMESVDQAYLDAVLKSQGLEEGEITGSSSDVKVQHDVSTLEDIKKAAQNLGKGDEEVDCRVTLQFIELLMQMWGNQLNSRQQDEKMSVRGKMALATYTQTQNYIRPLMRKLKSRKIPPDILDSLQEIVILLLDRDYIKANDAYLQMAIGNAPWPIGVTMVGIHARTGREKIFAKNVAHVLNDETQRKYIQGLKRLMTKCQQFFPTAPSRSVDYGAID